jgi:hypothetical protein
MDKFKMELTWHNCKTCPPKEKYNPWLVYTNGYYIASCEYDKRYGFSIDVDDLHEYWWADIAHTVRGASEFKECNNV